ncbi:MAG: hypothetical protein RIS54_1699 [Verrucomicrobiota bacterium]
MKNANPVSWRRVFLVLLVLALPLAGCARAEPEPPPAPKTVADWFTIKVGDQSVRVQFAVTPGEMQHGLMERRELGPDDGMLFVYLRPQRLSFWMRNTPLPLDIGFFKANGELAEIYPLLPFDEHPVQSRSLELQFALEMNQGWFKAHGLRPGDKLDLAAVKAALKARDFPTRQFGLGD